MKIAITLLTCGRADYTVRTVSTLLAANPDLSDRFVLLQGDDLSTPEQAHENRSIGHEVGFDLVVAPHKQYGVARMTALLFEAALMHGVDAVLNLQNDWECLRPIPLDDIEAIFSDEGIYNIRMYGAYKSATGRCGIHHGGLPARPVVQWQPHDIAGYEFGDIHWGHPPCVTRIEEAIALTRGATTESDSRMRSGKIKKLTARVVENVFSHIGRERTPGFKS